MDSVKNYLDKPHTDMTTQFDDLYSRAKSGAVFQHLFKMIVQEENILLAVKEIKSNRGSKTPGPDGHTIQELLAMDKDDLVAMVRRKFQHYQPGKVNRVEVSKENGSVRQLGIANIMDRVIQKCVAQVLNPICEAKFSEYSNGFRAFRSTKTAVAQVHVMMQIRHFQFVVKLDIEHFFDNVEHSKLIRQIWSLGIRDKKVISVIKAILSSEIQLPDGSKTRLETGIVQGGTLSPLLANICLNEFDQWLASQWENMKLQKEYRGKRLRSGAMDNSHKFRAMRDSTGLKEIAFVRYADDVLIFSKDYQSAVKIRYAAEQWLSERLHLRTNPEKTRIVNLQKQSVEYLGLRIKLVPKRQKWVVESHIATNAKKQIIAKLREIIRSLQYVSCREESYQAISYYNYYVAGIHSYYSMATMIAQDCREIDQAIRFSLEKRMRDRIHRPTLDDRQKLSGHYIMKRYGKSKQLRIIDGQPVIPVAYIKTVPPKSKLTALNPYTVEGRAAIDKSKDVGLGAVLDMLRRNTVNLSLEYTENRISRFLSQNGRCYVTGEKLEEESFHCHHVTPRKDGGDDSYDNLVIVSTAVHILIHAVDSETIAKYLGSLHLTPQQLEKLNYLRIKAGNQPLE